MLHQFNWSVFVNCCWVAVGDAVADDDDATHSAIANAVATTAVAIWV